MHLHLLHLLIAWRLLILGRSADSGRHVQALQPERRVVFLDTGQQAPEATHAAVNTEEAAAVVALAAAHCAAGLAPACIGVITPHRSQVRPSQLMLLPFSGFQAPRCMAACQPACPGQVSGRLAELHCMGITATDLHQSAARHSGLC